MMRARVNLITADPDRMADTIGYIKISVRPAVESMDGSLGLSLYANAEIGVAVLESFWESSEALIHSEQMAAPRRTDVVGGGPGRPGARLRDPDRSVSRSAILLARSASWTRTGSGRDPSRRLGLGG
jgi:hypothetical protein